jgi:AAA15 family ATPase/GTPase
MIVKFAVTNFKTFRKKAELNFIASNYDKSREEDNLYQCNTFGFNLLKSAVVYGANASGKSKLIESLLFMRRFILSSSRESQKGESINVEPFLLSTETIKMPSEFEIIFVHHNQLFRYGFEVDKEKVISEWLYYRPLTKEIELFVREGQHFSVHDRKFAKGSRLAKDKMVRENALMVSVAAQFNEEIANTIIDWFRRFRIISALQPKGYKGYSLDCLHDNVKKKKILEMLKKADFNISDIYLEKVHIAQFPKKMPENLKKFVIQRINNEKAELFALNTVHQVFDKNDNIANQVIFDMDDDESSGTNQFFALSGPIIDVIENGYVLVIDELDSKLHPNLVLKIIEIFNSAELNPKNAQLIFNTHDTNLLSTDIFRRDQVWFVEKDRLGAASLFSLADFKEVRKEANFENNYVKGKYGAIPVIREFENLHNISD